jgi:hypothetical protein
MTDDLVKRLRSPEVFIDTGGMFSPVAHQAADRIEQLEAALREICDGPRDADKSYAELFAEVCIEARAALAGEKKDD